MSLQNQTYAITGGAGAIGRVVAATFIEAGAQVVLLDRDERIVQQAAADLGGGVIGLAADLGNFEATQAAIENVVVRAGALTGVINIAGGFAYAPVVDTLPPDYDAMLDINLRTLYNTSRAALPLLLEQGFGLIAGVSAAPGLERGVANMALYGAAKAGVAAFLQALAGEVKSKGIGVSIIYPMGAVDTPGNRKTMPNVDPKTWIDPRDLGAALVFAAELAPRRAILELPVYPPI